MAVVHEPASPPVRRVQVAMLQPLLIRNFLLFWTGETACRFGDEFQTIALATVVIGLTGKASALASILMVQSIPASILLLYGGVAVDRLGARRVMIAANVSIGLVVAGLALASATGGLALKHLYAYAVLIGLIWSIFQPASYAMPSLLVDRRQLPAANALHQIGRDAGAFVAAPVGGALVAAFGAVPAFLVKSASSLFSASLQSLTRVPHTASVKQRREGTWEQLLSGLRIVRADPVLKGCMLYAALLYLGFMGAHQVGVAGLAQITLGAGPQGQGMMRAALGIGGLIGTVTAGNVRNFGRVGTLVPAASVVIAAGYALAGFAPNVGIASAALFVSGVAYAFRYVPMISLVQSRAAPAERGRVMSVLMLCSFGVFPFSYALAGVVANLLGPRGILVLLGGAMPLVAAAVACSIRDFRSHVLDLR